MDDAIADRPRRAPRAPLLAALSLLLSATASAQTEAVDPDAPWLQAELIVFRQIDTSSAADEAWPHAPQLAYPDPIRILLDPTALDADAEPAPPPEAAGAPADESTPAAAGTTLPPEEEEVPYTLLPPELTVLEESASRLGSSSAYRVLRHVAWRQPAPRGREVVNILLHGGAARGDHFELEGFVTIRRSQFVHVDFNLWLNDFADGEASVDAHPSGTLLPPLPRSPEEPEPVVHPFAAAAEGGTPSSGFASTMTPAEAGDAADAAEGATAVAEPPAPLRSARTVVLRATRRMPLGQVHYVDHPLFGVILTLRAYDPAGPAQTAPDSSGAATSQPDPATPPVSGAAATPPVD